MSAPSRRSDIGLADFVLCCVMVHDHRGLPVPRLFQRDKEHLDVARVFSEVPGGAFGRPFRFSGDYSAAQPLTALTSR